jgi:tetratricopeptide (TPR) repeat protein
VSTRKDAEAAVETLREIDSVFDRAAEWALRNPMPVLLGLAAILGLAAALGGMRWHFQRSELTASQALAEVQTDYLAAMGAQPGQLDVPEPANPETAKQVRVEHIERFQKVAAEHAGHLAAVQAWLEAGNLQQELGDLEAAQASWQKAADAAEQGSAVRALALSRLGSGLEAAGRWEDAARAHEEAAAIETYPLRFYALIDAARCWAEAGDRARAVALFDRVEAESPGLEIPEHVRARLREAQVAGR